MNALLHQPARLHAQAAAGAAACLIAAALLRSGWAEAAILLAALVVVPLAMAAVDGQLAAARPWRWAAALQLPAALVLALSFAPPRGLTAALLTLPWLLFALLAAAAAVQRLFKRRAGGESAGWRELALEVGVVYLAGGAAWAFVSRFGWRPFGFDHVIVELTPMHLHYAGFALSLAAHLAARAVPGRIAEAVSFGSLVGFSLLAGAMTLRQTTGVRWPELLGVLAFAVLACGVAWLQACAAVRSRRPGVLTLLGVSSVSLASSMLLAVVYGFGQYLGRAWIDIPGMLPTHGGLNALGFAVLGMLGWNASLAVTRAARRPHRSRSAAAARPLG